MRHFRLLGLISLIYTIAVFSVTLIVSGAHPHRYYCQPFEKQVSDEAGMSINATLQRKTKTRDGESWLVSTDSVTIGGKRVSRVRFQIYQTEGLSASVGDKLLISGTFHAFDHARNPGNFDLHFYEHVRRISGVIEPATVTVKHHVLIPFKEKLYQISCRADEMIRQCVGESDGSVITSILLGNKNAIDEDMKELYQKCGIAHILAISGLHLSLIGAGLYRLLKKCGTPYRPRCIAVSVLVGVYCVVIGPQVAAARAVIMLLLRFLAEGFGRAFDAPTAIGLSSVIILMRNPWYLWDASFQLSFAAVGAVYLVLPLTKILNNQFNTERNELVNISKLIESLMCSFAVFALSMPLLMWHFFEIAPLSILVNLLVIPLLSFVLILGATGAAVLMVLPVLGDVVGRLPLYGAKCIMLIYHFICRLTLKFPFGRIVTGRPPVWMVIFYYAIVVSAVIVIVRRLRRYRRACAAGMNNLVLRNICFVPLIVILGAAVLITPLNLICHKLPCDPEIVMLDIGQGDCLYVDDGHGMHILVDAGSSSIEKIAKKRIEPFLLSRGVSNVDAVFVSHGDEDHINGISQMLHRREIGVEIGSLIVTEDLYRDEALNSLIDQGLKEEVNVYSMGEGDMIQTGSLTWECLGPPTASTLKNRTGKKVEPGNEASMVLLLRFKAFSMLFTGDLEGSGEESFVDVIEKKGLANVSVLKVAHHGSKNSTSEKMLDRLSPKFAVISAGKNNRYGHPHRETLERIEKAGAQWFCTADSGAVMIKTEGAKMTAETFIVE